MKGFVKFFLGMIVGALLCLGVLYYIGNYTGEGNDKGIHGLTLFEQPGESVSTKAFKVIQVDNYGNALAMENSSSDLYLGVLVLFLAEEGTSYYDDQIIKIPSGMCARQLGTFRYKSGMGTVKTVPAVAISKK